jgi:carbon storage regulator
VLTLSRREGETIHIGDDIIIKVQRIGSHNVKIGIDAPASVPVHRSEVYLEIQEQMEREEGEHHD